MHCLWSNFDDTVAGENEGERRITRGDPCDEGEGVIGERREGRHIATEWPLLLQQKFPCGEYRSCKNFQTTQFQKSGRDDQAVRYVDIVEEYER